jgi:hypothetical protein
MYCPKCQSQNEESAQFCRTCGANLRYPQVENQSNDVSSTLLLVYILIAFFATVIQLVIQRALSISCWESPWKYVMGLIWIISNISFILPALAIKNKSLKIIGIIFAAILVIYHAYGNIEFLMRSY